MTHACRCIQLVDKSQRAFVSFVRGYKEHQCNFIFRFDELALDELARAYCMLQLPKMAELRGKSIDFHAENVEIKSIPFRDKAKEKQRQKSLAKSRAEAAAAAEAEADEGQQHTNDTEHDCDWPEDSARSSKGKSAAACTRQRDDDEAMDETMREAGLLKKLKRGEISEAEFDRLCYGNSDDEKAPTAASNPMARGKALQQKKKRAGEKAASAKKRGKGLSGVFYAPDKPGKSKRSVKKGQSRAGKGKGSKHKGSKGINKRGKKR